jgi:uncharacterized protein (DUF2237 family)
MAMTEQARNVLGTELILCSYDPLTGFFRDGCCKTDSQDQNGSTINASAFEPTNGLSVQIDEKRPLGHAR